MPRLTRIYTRKGDAGVTSLGGGQRVRKDDRRVEAFGTVDELNSFIGVALTAGLDEAVGSPLRLVQSELFDLGAELCFEGNPAAGVPLLCDSHVRRLEELMDRWNASLGNLEDFIVPGGSVGAAHLHVARSVCRRAERALVALLAERTVREQAVRYLNRLSDALFVAARFENRAKGESEPLWDRSRADT